MVGGGNTGWERVEWGDGRGRVDWLWEENRFCGSRLAYYRKTFR